MSAVQHWAKEPEIKILCEIPYFTVLLPFFKEKKGIISRRNGIIITTISAQKLSPDIQVEKDWVQKGQIYLCPTYTLPWSVPWQTVGWCSIHPNKIPNKIAQITLYNPHNDYNKKIKGHNKKYKILILASKVRRSFSK